ncbi:ammonium/urea transporter [Lucifera butyrica]|uniref:Ammonium transporter n=1 Tax=Lucifera butyrica TaxID=1351585 RepID=A0A498R8U3_9FIRM|nr:ammonium transporter [Lucifera butyrica]VBB07357.1 ammonium/urea transporter [Lucifera butyrica]
MVTISSVAIGLNTVWVLLCAALVFLMEAGFAALEAGFIHSRNSLNIIMKVLMDCTVGIIGYFICGFAIMYGADEAGLIGISGFLVQGDFSHLNLSVPVYAFWLFQAAFAIAMATIVSGAVAERMKFAPYIIFSLLATVLIYPLAGHWVWSSGGWLNKMGMLDFAGSAVVHALGGWAALAAVTVLGPRTGRFGKDGAITVMPGHNLPLAALGAFILWFGWFGFNPGSTLSGLDLNIAKIAVNTNLSAAMGGTIAALLTLFRYGKADPSMVINGALGGLVAITAGCAYVEPVSALIIGAFAGILIVIAVPLLDKLHFDDPVGAVAVHGVCGTFGTIAVGLFAEKSGLFYGGGVHLLFVQTIGVIAVSALGYSLTYALFRALKATVGIRVTEEDEIVGLDLSEHGIAAYNDLEYSPLKSLQHFSIQEPAKVKNEDISPA